LRNRKLNKTLDDKTGEKEKNKQLYDACLALAEFISEYRLKNPVDKNTKNIKNYEQQPK